MDGEIDDDTSSWGSVSQVLIMILMIMWHLGIPSILITAQGTLIERDSWMRMVSLLWTLYIEPWIREWLQQDPDGIFMGASLSILNGGIFNHDDILIECRNILEGEYELTSSCGEDWFSYLSVIMDHTPHGHPFTLLLTERCLLVRPVEGNRDEMVTDGSLTHGHSSDEDYSLADSE